MTAAQSPDTRLNQANGKLLPRTLAAGLALFGFLPVANWIRGGHEAPWYAQIAQSWISGTAIVAGVVVVLTILSRRRLAAFASQLGHRAGTWFERSPRRNSLLISGMAACIYSVVAVFVFDARPLFIDEIIQLYQARLYASGQLMDHVGPFPEFFGALNVVSVGDYQFGQFPPGGPAHFMIGVLIGAPWLVNPLLGGAAVYVFSQFVRHVESEPAVALAATLLLAFSPLMIFMSASQMNHVPTLVWVLISWLACARLTSAQPASRLWAFLLAAAAGVTATVRPVDALVMTGPALALGSAKVFARRDLSSTVAIVCGLAIPLVALLAYNNATTGSPFLFGYELMWGKSHSLGFHDSPWGMAHTPARGVELLSLYALRMQSYLFESPLPSLLPVVATLAIATKIARMDRMMLWAMILLCAAYFAYWHDGFYLGPRFLFVLTPVFALLCARAPRSVAELTHKASIRRYAFITLTTAVLLGLATGFPARARIYSQSLRTSRYRLSMESLGRRPALVFVRESWGSQVLARLWGRHIERPAAELLYRGVDTCELDSVLTFLEQHSTVGKPAMAVLWPLLADSSAVRPSTLSPDITERVRPGRSYSPRCLAQIAADHEGTALYPPFLSENRKRAVFARDLGGRNAQLAVSYRGFATFLALPPRPGESQYRLLPLDVAATAPGQE